jgi:pimeloyl-ACP methyl ester carboxylesterase
MIYLEDSQFKELIGIPEMSGIKNRVVWLHVSLPGQESDAADLEVKKYPSLDELADELVCVLDHFKLHQAICMGDGAGANICALFAIKHAHRCLGLVLIEPISSAVSFMQAFKRRLSHMSPLKNTYVVQNNYSTFDKGDHHSQKNLTLFADSFLK